MAATKQLHGFLLESKYSLDRTYQLNTPRSDTESGEREVMTQINGFIASLGAPINLRIGHYTIENVYGVNKVDGAPKADLAVVAYDKDRKKFVDKFWFSHKKGDLARDFQQYSGISERADAHQSGVISRHVEVQRFLSKIVPLRDLIVVGKKRFYATIKSKELVERAVYGAQYGSSQHGPNNIHGVAQGNPQISKGTDHYVLNFSKHWIFSPDANHFRTGDYTAVVGVKFTEKESYVYKGVRYRGQRVSIMPKAAIMIAGKAEEI